MGRDKKKIVDWSALLYFISLSLHHPKLIKDNSILNYKLDKVKHWSNVKELELFFSTIFATLLKGVKIQALIFKKYLHSSKISNTTKTSKYTETSHAYTAI